jgi:DNA-directed RNA polymerase subunit alpha
VFTAKTSVNVREILRDSGTFGPEQVKQLQAAIGGSQYSEVKQEAADLRQEVEEGNAPKGALLRLGITFYLLGKHDVAESYLKKVSHDSLAEFYHGSVLLALDRFDEAAKGFEHAAKLGFDPVQCHLCRAGAIRAKGDIDTAESLLRSISTQAATRADYSYQMGCILSDRGDTYGAVEYFERAVDMNPHHTRALFWLAGENCQRGNDEEAIRLYERSLSKAPLHMNALLNLGLLYEDNEHYAAAAYCFRRVLDINPNHQRARLYLRDIEAAGDMYYDEESLRDQARLKQLLEIPVTDFELSVRARNCLQKMGVQNLGDLTKVTEQELLGSKNFGETSLQEIKEMMASKGLRLGQSLEKGRPREYPGQGDLSPQEQALLNRPVADLNLSVRARKCMTRLQITTFGELVMRTPDELLESKNFGVTSLNEVRSKLADLGLKLRND